MRKIFEKRAKIICYLATASFIAGFYLVQMGNINLGACLLLLGAIIFALFMYNESLKNQNNYGKHI